MLVEWLNLEYFKSIYVDFWIDSLYIILYLGALLFIVKKGNSLKKQIFFVPFVMLLVTIYNPFVMEPILKIVDWRDRYARFYWILPVGFLCAYTLAETVEAQKRKTDKWLVTVFAILLLLLSGSETTAWEVDENIYKIDDDVIAVAELIQQAKEEERPTVMMDSGLYYWIRQYDPSIVEALSHKEMEYYRWKKAEHIDASEQYESDRKAISMMTRGVEIDPAIANRMFEKREIDFFVCNKEYFSDYYMEQLNLEYVDAAGDYELYRYVQD